MTDKRYFFCNFVIGFQNRKYIMKRYSKIAIITASIIGLYVFALLSFGFPIPRGHKVNSDYYTYYQNIRGIYYISVEHSLNLINYGNWGYLKDVDKATFMVLDDNLAKDATHVWFGSKLIENVDAKTFHINANGVACDKNNVYIRDFSSSSSFIRPSHSSIDAETAEYFVYRLGRRSDEWIRDKNYVYYNDKRTDVDRNSFRIIGEDWFIDKNYVYQTVPNSKTGQWELQRIDSLQHPVEPGYQYFRNGRNVIYGDSVIVRNIDIKRFKEIGVGKYLVNDMLFLNGEPFLKDSLDVENATFYFYGRIATDKQYVFFDRKQLNDINAATFHQISDEVFEDRNYIYTIKENSWNDEYPFDKKKKEY